MSTLVSLPTAAPAPDYQSIDRPLNFSNAAAAKVRELIQEEGNAELALRVYIQGGGCSGFQYGFEFDENRAEESRLERRVALLRRDNLDPDMLDERARVVLNFAAPGELVIFIEQPGVVR